MSLMSTSGLEFGACLNGSRLVSKRLKLGLKFFSSTPFEIANVLFCDDYFRIAPLLLGSPNYLSIFFPNLPPGWLVQAFSRDNENVNGEVKYLHEKSRCN